MTVLNEPALIDGDVRDAIVDLLGGYGEAVDFATVRRQPLAGRHLLWLVTGGAMDLFAVDAEQRGRWHFIGRLERGAILPAPVRGPRHTLVGRPLQGCELRRIQLSEVIRLQRDVWSNNRPEGELSAAEEALTRGIDLGLSVMFEPTLEGLPPRDFVPLEPGSEVEVRAGQHGRSVAGIVWIEVVSGQLQYSSGPGARYDREAGDVLTISEHESISCESAVTLRVRGTRGLLADGVLWQNLLNHEARYLFTLDRWIERRDRAYEERMAAGREAGETVRAEADHALLATIQLADQDPAEAVAPADDTAFAACRLVATAAGITLRPAPAGEVLDGRLDPIERIAVRSRFRTREVRLAGQWWREDVGPLLGHRRDPGTPVALLWRRGRYHAVDPTSGRGSAVTAASAEQLRPTAVMFYRPLPDRPMPAWRLMLFGLKGSGTDARNLVIGGLVAVTLGSSVPVATGQVLGVLVPNADRNLIVQLCMALVVGSLAAAAFMLLENIAILRMEGRFDAILQAAVWDRLLRLPTTFFAGHSTGELASAALGISGIRRAVSGISSVAVHAGAVGTVNFLLLLWYSVPLALAAAGLLALSALVFLALGFRQLRWQHKLIDLLNTLNNRAFQTLRGLPKLRVAAAENFAYAHWARDFRRSRELERRVGRTRNLVTVFNAAYVPMCTLVLFVLLAGPARDALSVSGFLTFNAALVIMLTAMIQLTGAITAAGEVVPLFQQLKPVLNELPEVREVSAAPGELSGEIEVNHLSFSYAEDGPKVVDDVSFHILPGEFVAIVGGSGCGKSTLLRLLIGFNGPTAGTVLYDGQDLAGLDQAAVRRQCGVVLQNAQPLTGSILDCICGTERFSLDEAWEAADMAGLSEDINQMPMGMHTVLSDGGGTLSGGQRQRLMIAQALIRKPRILFFDEATSALDNETQRIVTESTRKLHATRIVIAHRLSTIMDADRVIVMSAGRLAQHGTPSELLTDTGGLFHQLVRRQVT